MDEKFFGKFVELSKKDQEYLDPIITAAEYLDDVNMYVDERPTAIVEIDNLSLIHI